MIGFAVESAKDRARMKYKEPKYDNPFQSMRTAKNLRERQQEIREEAEERWRFYTTKDRYWQEYLKAHPFLGQSKKASDIMDKPEWVETEPGKYTKKPLESAIHDRINHPTYYMGKGGDIECIKAMESMLTPMEFIAHCRGLALKYIWRAGQKNDLGEDLGKAMFYLSKATATWNKLKKLEEE